MLEVSTQVITDKMLLMLQTYVHLSIAVKSEVVQHSTLHARTGSTDRKRDNTDALLCLLDRK